MKNALSAILRGASPIPAVMSRPERPDAATSRCNGFATGSFGGGESPETGNTSPAGLMEGGGE